MTANSTPFHQGQLVMNPNARFHLVQFFTTFLTWLLFSISRAVSHDTTKAALICLLVSLCVGGIIGVIEKVNDIGVNGLTDLGISVFTVLFASIFVMTIGTEVLGGLILLFPALLWGAVDELKPSELSKGRVAFSVLIQLSITVYLMLH